MNEANTEWATAPEPARVRIGQHVHRNRLDGGRYSYTVRIKRALVIHERTVKTIDEAMEYRAHILDTYPRGRRNASAQVPQAAPSLWRRFVGWVFG